MLEMKQGLEDISFSAMHPFIDDNVHDEGESVFGQDSSARFINGSLIKNRRLNSERSETGLYSSYDCLLESRAKSQELYVDNERMPPNSLTFSKGENVYSNCEVFSSPDSSVSPRFTRESFDFRRLERHYCIDGKKGTATEAGRSLTRSEPDLDPFLLDCKYSVDTNDALYKGYLVREGGNNRNDKLKNVLGLNHKDNYVRLGSLSEKFGIPLGGEQGRIDEPRFSSVDNQIKTSYVNLSTTLNLPSRNVESQEVDDYMFNRRTSAINELDIENVTRTGISPKYDALSQLNCSSSKDFNTSFLNVQFPDCNPNYCTYESVFDDDIIRARIPDPPSLHRVRSYSPTVGGQSMKDTNHYLSHCNCRAMSRGKTCEADGFIRSYISDVGNQVPGYIYSDYKDRDVQFSPDDFGFSPLNVRYGSHFHPYGVSPKYLSCQMPEVILTSCEIQSPRANLTDSNLQNLEYDAVNGELAFYNNVYGPPVDNKVYNSSECGACTGSEKQRKSVFTRLTSSSTTPAKHDRVNETDTDIDSPVDELMEILRRGEKLGLKKTKRKNPENQHLGEGEKEKKKNSTMMNTSLDNCHGKSESVLVPKKLTEESNKTVDRIVHETLTETRAVEFRRRREKITSMCEKTNECCSKDIKKEKAEPEIQLEDDKQPKRRKLVRPVFAVSDVNSETNDSLRSFVNSVGHD